MWRKITTYTSWYKSPKTGDVIVVHSLSPQPKYRTFRAAAGNRKYKRVKTTETNRKVIIMAKSAKTKSTKGKKQTDEDEILDEELEDLEDVEDLDDLEDEESEDSDDDDDEEEEEEAPAKKKRSKRVPGVSRSRTTDGKVGTSELATAAGVDSRGLRMYLRKANVSKDSETGRYEWDSLKDPEVKKIIKAVKGGAVKEIQKESLQKLKDRKAADEPTPKKKKGKKKKAA